MKTVSELSRRLDVTMMVASAYFTFIGVMLMVSLRLIVCVLMLP
jgi:hypothetical protein